MSRHARSGGHSAYSEKHYWQFNPVGQPCWRCGNVSSTRDHQPPLALHDHVANSGCCVILPACRRCNCGDGSRIRAELKGRRVVDTRRYGILGDDASDDDPDVTLSA